MTASPYLLHITSRPTVVSDTLWKKWYSTEHLPDLVNAKVVTRATLYEEIPTPMKPNPTEPRKFLAIYQTDHADPIMSKEYGNVSQTSELFTTEGGTNSNGDNGDFDGRNYELIDVFDPLKNGQKPSPQLFTVEACPSDDQDYDAFMSQEHLPMISKTPGYRRSLRYKLGSVQTPITHGEPFPFMTIHELDDTVKAITSEESQKAHATEWTAKRLAEDQFVTRGWKLVCAEGWN